MRVAAIDQGTNTTRLLVADVVDGRLEEVLRRSAITRLGEGVDHRRRLLPLPITRVRNVLTDYRREAERLGAERTLLIATSAVRDAENGEAFLGEIEWSYGFATQLLTGDDEARMLVRGVGGLAPGTLVFDVGGGSTELVAGDAHASVDVGAVRLTERFLHADPPTDDELDACAAHVRGLLPDLDVRDAVGVAGTVTTLAALDLGLNEYDRERVDGHRLPRAGVDAQLARLAGVPLEVRREIPALEPERAPVIVGGGSTELVAGDAHVSVDVGAVRLTERFLHSDPPTDEELDACAAHVRGLLPDLDVRDAIGVAGTVTTLAALDLGLGEYDRERVDGHRLPRAGVDAQLARLAAVPLEVRREIPALEPERAPVIVGGAVVVREILDRYGLAGLTVSERDILDGAALAAAELPEPVEGDAPPGAYTCC